MLDTAFNKLVVVCFPDVRCCDDQCVAVEDDCLAVTFKHYLDAGVE